MARQKMLLQDFHDCPIAESDDVQALLELMSLLARKTVDLHNPGLKEDRSAYTCRNSLFHFQVVKGQNTACQGRSLEGEFHFW